MSDVAAIEYQEFETGVQVLKNLRDDGRYAILLSRMGQVRFAGSVPEFQQKLSENFHREINSQKTTQIMSEIRQFSRVAAYFGGDTAQAVSIIENGILGAEFKKLSDESAKEPLREIVRTKLRAVTALLSPAYQDRRRRLQTATDPFLEDVDVEIVSERHEYYRAAGPIIDQPFLRLRLRYTDASGAENPFFTFAVTLLPSFIFMNEDSNWPCKNFLLECDETDIDFLIFRLREAKRLLSEAVEKSVVE